MLFDWYDNIIMHWETNGQMVEAFSFELNMSEKISPPLTIRAKKLAYNMHLHKAVKIDDRICRIKLHVKQMDCHIKLDNVLI